MKNLVLATVLLSGALVLTSGFTTDPKHPATTNKPAAPRAAVKWQIDPMHSNVKFSVTHMVVSEVEGSFRKFDGAIQHAKPDLSDAKVNFSVDVNSINTDNERRDGHLKSEDFFNAEKFPQMKFESTAFTPVSGKKYKLVGNLTIRDITRPVTFDVIYNGSITNGGKSKAGFKAVTTINRFDYNLKWDRATEAGSLVVDKEVTVTINAEFDKVD